MMKLTLKSYFVVLIVGDCERIVNESQCMEKYFSSGCYWNNSQCVNKESLKTLPQCPGG